MRDRFPPLAAQEHPGLPALLDALGAQSGEVRLVGGVVRDTLLDIATNDVDCATVHLPDAVIARVRAAGFKAVPTGIEHGTITAVLPSGPVEITTLRKDVSTNGRRATIAYTDCWREDAARRDFTINALSADPLSGELYDYFEGLLDLAAGRVRFIGDALTRIAEDHLRILRFFRFHARFGQGEPDPAAIDACARRSNDLMALSRERIADELTKLLALPDPVETVALMVDHGIFRPVLPEIDTSGVSALGRLVTAEQTAGIAPDALRRLAALLPDSAELRQSVGTRLKMSNAARKRLHASSGPAQSEDAQVHAYRIGRESAIDRLLLSGATDAAARLSVWEVPRLPVGGGVFVERGIAAGPEVAALLRKVEERWISEGFPSRARVNEIIDELIRSR